MVLPRQPRPPAAPDLLYRLRASVTGEVAGLLVVELVLGVPAESSCFLLLPQCHLDLSGMLLVSQGPSLPSAAPPFLQDGALPPGLQARSAGLARGSVLGTTWFLLLTSTTAPTPSHRRAAGEVVAARQWGDKGNMEDGVEDITVMRLDVGKVGGGGQVEEEEEEEGTVG